MSSYENVTENYQRMKRKRAQLKDSWGLGEEDSWSLNQEEQKIYFLFSDGKTVSANVQIIGTYDIPDQKFLWAWANVSLNEELKVHSLKFREKLREKKVNIWLQEEFSADEMTAEWITYLAAEFNKADGFYSGRVRDSVIHLTFSAINIAYDNENAQNDDKLAHYHQIQGEEISDRELLVFIQDYFSQMYTIDKTFQAESQSTRKMEYTALVNTYLGKQHEIYENHWFRSDNSHRPCSLSWPSEYNLENTKNWRLFHLVDEIYRVNYIYLSPAEQLNAFIIERINGEWKIIDFFHCSD